MCERISKLYQFGILEHDVGNYAYACYYALLKTSVILIIHFLHLKNYYNINSFEII